MALQTKTLIADGSKGHHRFYLDVIEDSTSTSGNTSSLSYVLRIDATSWNWNGWGSSIKYTIVIGSHTITGTIPEIPKNSAYTIKSGSGLSVAHNSDGKKSITISLSIDDNANQSYTSGDASASDTMTLTTIPRYLTINSFSVKFITETSAMVTWSVSDPRSGTYYSLDGGNTWIGSATYGESLASDNKSGSFNVNGLNANTKYNIKIKIKRTDSGLWTESGVIGFTTYDYPHCTSTPNFTIGNALTISLYNPLGRSVTIKGIAKSNNTSIFGATNVTGTSATGFNDSDSVNAQYSSIPNAKSGTYKVEVTYGSITRTRDNGNTYSIKGTEKPTLGSITYADTNTTVTAITGNNQHIVQNQSNLKVTYTKATAKNSASISKYTFVLNGVTKESTSAGGTIDFGKINSANNLTLTMTVTDSRGLTSSATKTITMLSYSAPNFTTSLKRLNNYEDTTYLKVDGSVSSVNGKNKIEVLQYRYKLKDGNYADYYSIEDNKEYTLTLSKENIYIFEIIIKDTFGTIVVKNATLNKGVFPLFIDTEKNAVGINEFPREGEALRVKDGDIVLEKALNGSPKMKVTNGSVSASLHVGAGGVNRGIWDDTDNKWMLYNDGTNVFLNSNLYPMSRGYNNETGNTELFDDVAEGESFYRSGLYSASVSSTWYNIINIRHRNGHADGLDYGLQIRKAFGLNSTMQVRSQNSKTWSGWEAIYRSKTLYENSSGSNGTVTLNETSANFTYLEIFYSSGDTVNSIKVYSPNGKKASLISRSVETSLMQVDLGIVVISGTTLTLSDCKRANIPNGAVPQIWSASNIYIARVVGYR